MKAYLSATTIGCFFLLSRGAAFCSPSGILSSRAASDLSRLNDSKTIATHRVHIAAGAVPRRSTRLYNSLPEDPAVAAQIEKAKRLLEDARKKQKDREAAAGGADDVAHGAEAEGATLPFFAAKEATAAEQARKIKSRTESGIVADGAAMASLSQSEPWEVRPLDQMFEQEARMDYDGNEVEEEGSGLAERDLAASIYNLRKALQNDDFRKVFNSRNRFIGDVD